MKGFTLVELLITISVLVIIGAIGMRIYAITLANSADQQRLKDLNTIKQALDLYRYDHKTYPESVTFNCSTPGALSYGGKTYLTKIPNDLDCAKDRNYQYLATDCVNSVCIKYVLCAKKEGSRSLTNPSACTSTSCGTAGNCDMGLDSP
jgi:prepilin-type N-terminal cleavage/methylation domain-containing protein